MYFCQKLKIGIQFNILPKKTFRVGDFVCLSLGQHENGASQMKRTMVMLELLDWFKGDPVETGIFYEGGPVKNLLIKSIRVCHIDFSSGCKRFKLLVTVEGES